MPGASQLQSIDPVSNRYSADPIQPLPRDPRARRALQKLAPSCPRTRPGRWLKRAEPISEPSPGALYWFMRQTRPRSVAIEGLPAAHSLVLLAAGLSDAGGRCLRCPQLLENHPKAEAAFASLVEAGLEWLLCRAPVIGHAMELRVLCGSPEQQRQRLMALRAARDRSRQILAIHDQPLSSAQALALNEDLRTFALRPLSPIVAGQHYWSASGWNEER